jgi:hypothetical protein
MLHPLGGNSDMNGNGKGTCSLGKMGRHVLVIGALILGCQLCCRAQLAGSDLIAVQAAAKAGNPAAQDRLAGEFIRRGNLTRAELWYSKAAKQGDANAQARLGEMLLTHAGLPVGLKTNVLAASGMEAIKWLTRAANASNTLAQAELAFAYFSGQFVKADLLEAYKWGDLAAKAPPSTPGSTAGRSVRDAASLKMSFDQIAIAKLRVATFCSHTHFIPEPPEPSWVSEIRLTGISGPVNARLAVINNQTFGVGDTGVLKVAGKMVQVRCLEVQERSARLQIAGLDKPKELTMADDEIKN